MDACEIANFLANELFMQQYISVDGMQGSLPTATTPTLTPTTLRSIEQEFHEIDNEPNKYQAKFVPPVAPTHITGDMDYSHSGGSESDSYDNSNPNEDSMSYTGTEQYGQYSFQQGDLQSLSVPKESGEKKRNSGGRRPQKPSNLSPEEEEKRKIRRERNKMAAARCRKRRVDQTNDLCKKVAELEAIKSNGENEQRNLMIELQRLESTYGQHLNNCMSMGRHSPYEIKPSVPDILDARTTQIKSEPDDDEFDDGPTASKRQLLLTGNNPSLCMPQFDNERIKLPNVSTIITNYTTPMTPSLNTPIMIANSIFPHMSQQSPHMKSSKPRPSSLNVAQAHHGIPIQTPSSGVFNFDSLMDGGTGLTPIRSSMPSCSSQNKNPHLTELNTPQTSEPSKLVSL